MPSNSPEYQKQYRRKHAARRKEISVGLPVELHREFSAYARKHGMSLAGLMRESTDLQIRGSQLKSSDVASELKELRFLIANIANNVNQMARHSNRVKEVTDENALFGRLQELDELVIKFVDSRLTSPP